MFILLCFKNRTQFWKSRGVTKILFSCIIFFVHYLFFWENIFYSHRKLYPFIVCFVYREDPRSGALLDPMNRSTWEMTSGWSSSTNILGLVVFSVATGVAIALSGQLRSNKCNILKRWHYLFFFLFICSILIPNNSIPLIND